MSVHFFGASHEEQTISNLYSGLQDTERPWPAISAKFTILPLPPNTPTTFYATIYLPGGTSTKTFHCSAEMKTSDLLSEVQRSSFSQITHVGHTKD